jgi:hypothetical protein
MTMAESVEVAPILGIRKIGVAMIPIPRIPPRYKYESFIPGRFFKLAVPGKARITAIITRALTMDRARTDPKLPIRLPRPEFNTLCIEMHAPARMPTIKKAASLIVYSFLGLENRHIGIISMLFYSIIELKMRAGCYLPAPKILF